jgi:8-oxo-dGTP pyrophosphatase MutT (NUDIX family)
MLRRWLLSSCRFAQAAELGEEPQADPSAQPEEGSEPVPQEQPKPKSYGMKQSYGGVVISGGKVLLLNPTNDFGGYKWTFPKGRNDPGEAPEETAIREVREETGYECEIVGKLPGNFAGTTTNTEYFLMRPLSSGSPGWETQEVRWADRREAEALIRMTGELGNQGGMSRDLAILSAAFGA